MRDPKRIKRVCQLLGDAWRRYPDQRLGQFLLNYVFGSIGRDSHIYHRDDDEVETLLKEFIEKLDAFEELPEAQRREQEELYLRGISEQNQKRIDKIKDVYKQNQEFINKLKDDWVIIRISRRKKAWNLFQIKD